MKNKVTQVTLLLQQFIFFSILIGSLSSTETKSSNTGKKIAIVGGGIGGTFAAKYLSDYDVECSLESITIYEPYSIISKYGGKSNSKEATGTNDEDTGDTENDNVIPYTLLSDIEQQGPRVSSIELSDGETIVELGASIIFNGNKLAAEMLENDGTLYKVKPLSSEKKKKADEAGLDTGMGIYNGLSDDNKLTWPLFTSNMTKDETTKTLLWRYNLDLYKISKITDDALTSFDSIYDILRSNHISSYDYKSPNDLWKQVGLSYAASVSLDQLLDDIGVSNYISWWRRWLLKDQGLVRDELFTAMNICNNNQNNAQMTGLAGLVNFVASKGDLFAVKGGNHRLVQSAFQQASSNYAKSCGAKSKDHDKVAHVPKRIKTIVSDFETKEMELFDVDGKRLGAYDVVIIATPLQFSDISFLTRGSVFDTNVLHPMTLNGMVDSEDSNANDHEHKAALGGDLPDSAIRSYTQVVTTIVSNANLNKSYFDMKDDLAIPKSILFTKQGREEKGISSVGRISSDVFKVFSSNELSEDTITSIFGKDVKVEYVKVWGNKNGGATPNFNGGGDSSFSTQFLLYDGGHGVGSYEEDSAALYYVNSMESAVSAIEISAIGALAVSKLVAQRLKLLQPIDNERSDEL